MSTVPPPEQEGSAREVRAQKSLPPHDQLLDSSGPAPFLAREAYRRQRLMDGARLMPAFGTALVLLPVLWVSVESPKDTATGYLYLFAIWLFLILLGAAIARRIAEPIKKDQTRGSARQSDPDRSEGTQP
ncbi:MAG: hypothetical protein MK107_09925 [Oceanicola sp.]|nr:hypothetical protein [Oceanicola sp.]